MSTSLSTEVIDFRLYLQQELIRRCDRNRNYSLRSFAKSLSVDASTLSQILRGTRPLSKTMQRKLALTLGLGPMEFERFNETDTQDAALSPKELRELSADFFAVMSDWYHDAILELSRIPSFQSNARWVAKKLGITVSEVNIAVERLQRLEFLTIDEQGNWINTLSDNTISTDFDVTSAALRKLQKQVLELSTKALETVPKPQRDHSSMMVTFDPDDLTAIKQKIKDFRRDVFAYCERKEARPSSVYQLAVSFFPITQD